MHGHVLCSKFRSCFCVAFDTVSLDDTPRTFTCHTNDHTRDPDTRHRSLGLRKVPRLQGRHQHACRRPHSDVNIFVRVIEINVNSNVKARLTTQGCAQSLDCIAWMFSRLGVVRRLGFWAGHMTPRATGFGWRNRSWSPVPTLT